MLNTRLVVLMRQRKEEIENEFEEVNAIYSKRIKKDVELGMIRIFNRYKEYGFLKEISSTQHSTSYKLTDKGLSEKEQEKLDEFVEEFNQLQDALDAISDMHYVDEILFSYNGVNIEWWR